MFAVTSMLTTFLAPAGDEAAGSKVPNTVCDPSGGASLLIDDGLAGRGHIDLVPA